MTLKRNTFEGLAVGVTPTTGTSGGASGDAFAVVSNNGSTMTVVDSPVLQGARAIRITGTSVSTGLVGFTGTPGKTPAAQMVFRIATDNATFPTVSFRHASGQAAAANITTGREINVSGIGSTGGGTSPQLALNTNYLLDMRLIQAATPTTSNGGIRARVTRMSDGVVIWDHTTDVADLGTAAIEAVRFGRTGSTGPMDLYIDSVAYDDNLAAYITPLSDFTAPVLATLVESPVGEIDLSWNAVPTATGYVVERSTTSATTGFTVVATLGAVTSWSNTGRPPSTQHWYRVKATK